MDIVLKNARLVAPSGVQSGCVGVRGGKIVEIAQHMDAGDAAEIDAGGAYLSAGFIDLHVHGGGGFSAMSGDVNEIFSMCDAHARYGTTALLPTTLAAPMNVLADAVSTLRRAAARQSSGAQILGVHLEGPCLSPHQSGAQSPDDLIEPADVDLTPLFDRWPGGVKIMGAAPELRGGLELGDWLEARGVLASIAHSNATYAQVVEAMAHGYRDVTHLYSGCSGLIRVNSYRIAGVIEAGLNLDGLTAQVIADGKHLPRELLQLIYRCKGAEGIILITDGLDYAAADLDEGTVYRQKNGVETLYEDGVMKMLDRQAFAGSVATMNRLVRNMRDSGVALHHAVRMATENPARRIGLTHKGRLSPGYDADLVLFDEQIDVKMTMIGGKIAHRQ